MPQYVTCKCSDYCIVSNVYGHIITHMNVILFVNNKNLIYVFD